MTLLITNVPEPQLHPEWLKLPHMDMTAEDLAALEYTRRLAMSRGSCPLRIAQNGYATAMVRYRFYPTSGGHEVASSQSKIHHSIF